MTARVKSKAEWGSILISPATHDLVNLDADQREQDEGSNRGSSKSGIATGIGETFFQITYERGIFLDPTTRIRKSAIDSDHLVTTKDLVILGTSSLSSSVFASNA